MHVELESGSLLSASAAGLSIPFGFTQFQKDLVLSITALPADFRKFMRAAHAGELQLKFKNLEAPAQLMYRLGHQVIFALVGISGASFAIILEGRNEYGRAEWGWWTARVAGVLLVWSWWSSRNLLRRR